MNTNDYVLCCANIFFPVHILLTILALVTSVKYHHFICLTTCVALLVIISLSHLYSSYYHFSMLVWQLSMVTICVKWLSLLNVGLLTILLMPLHVSYAYFLKFCLWSTTVYSNISLSSSVTLSMVDNEELPTSTATGRLVNSMQPLSRRTRSIKGDNHFGASADGIPKTSSVGG